MSKQRTLQQNKTLHLYFRLLSETLNEAGISQEVFVRGLEIDNSPESVKEVFKKLAKAKYLEDSTTKLSTKELMDLYEEMNRHTSKIGISIPFPSEEELSLKDAYGKL